MRDVRGLPEAFLPRRDTAGPRRYFPMDREGIVEWHTPGRPATEREFASLASLRRRTKEEPTLAASLFIFHCGRCGSTLLGRMLEADPGNRVWLEPNALVRFIEVKRGELDRPEVQNEFRTLVAAYGLTPTAEEQRLAFKLTSTLVRHADFLRACFPAAHFVYLLRDPTEVVASELRGQAAFLGRDRRAELAALFGGAERAVEDYAEAEWCAWYVDRNLREARRHAGEFARAIDYAEHRAAYLEFCNRYAGTARAATDPKMAAVLGSYSKQPGSRYSAADDARKVPPGLRELVEPVTREAYDWWRGRAAAGG